MPPAVDALVKAAREASVLLRKFGHVALELDQAMDAVQAAKEQEDTDDR